MMATRQRAERGRGGSGGQKGRKGALIDLMTIGLLDSYAVGKWILISHLFLWPLWAGPFGICAICCKKPYRGWT
jgi:hypothetical protein